MSQKPLILITNDDGIDAPGIRALYDAIAPHYRVVVVAPDRQRSGTGIGLTLHRPIELKAVDWAVESPIWSATGKPADCVKLGIQVALGQVPDMVISGINLGSNSGRNALYSGTVGGVMEAVLRNIPGIAFSCVEEENPDYPLASQYIPPLIDHFFNHPMPKGTLINVNFPACKGEELQGIKYARQGLSYILDAPFQDEVSQGYYISKTWDNHDEHNESDTTYLEQNHIAVTPIHVNELTDLDHYHKHKGLFESISASWGQEPAGERHRGGEGSGAEGSA